MVQVVVLPISMNAISLSVALLALLGQCKPNDTAKQPSLELTGFGLIAKQGSSKLISEVLLHPVLGHSRAKEDAPEARRSDGAVSAQQCAMLCASDPECKAHSVCQRQDAGDGGSQLSPVDCTLSKLAYMYQESGGGGGRAVVALVETTSAPAEPLVVRDDKCKIINKLYLDYFQLLGQSHENVLVHRYLLPVDGPEPCAKLCAARNFRSHGTFLDNVRAAIEHVGDGTKIGLQPRDGHKRDTSCKSFGYIAWQQLESRKDADMLEKVQNASLVSIKRELELDNSVADYLAPGANLSALRPPASGGYCSMPVSDYYRAPPGVEPLLLGMEQQLQVDVFHFDFSNFYHRMEGTRLLDVPKDADTRSALADVRYNVRISAKTKRYLIEGLERGDNHQSEDVVGWTFCAERCFRQFFGPWPPCRSFDVLTETLARSGKTIYRCLYNTNTLENLRALGRNELIQTSGPSQSPSGATVELAHFEPLAGLQLAGQLFS